MSFEPPKTDSKSYSELINEINKGIIKIPKFQREFVWDIDRTAKLLDSILKGYPIGTFILWQTHESMSGIKNIGDLPLPDTPEGMPTQYVLDGQQRITSLYAAYCGANISKVGKKKKTDYSSIVVNLVRNSSEDDDLQILTAKPTGNKHITLLNVLKFSYSDTIKLEKEGYQFSKEDFILIDRYRQAFQSYLFSTVLLRDERIHSAIEVFTRINTAGQTLTLFEIMSAKTYDEEQRFDMQVKWKNFIRELKSVNYESVSNSVILSLLSLMLSKPRECKRKTILALDKQEIINSWEDAVSALKDSIDYFRVTYRIPVSQLLPYDSLLVPFSFFFYRNKDKPNSDQQKYLEEFFWRMSLSNRYSSTQDTRLAKDVKRMKEILKNRRPDYKEIKVDLDSPQELIDTNFRVGNSYCKAVLCLLAQQEPKDFQDGAKVILDNSWLKIASSKNYHHFFPKKFLKRKNHADANSNSIVNITFVSDRLNKRVIRDKSPSSYINAFKDENPDINKALNSHFIDIDGFGIEDDDYETFLNARAELIFRELKERAGIHDQEAAEGEVHDWSASEFQDEIQRMLGKLQSK